MESAARTVRITSLAQATKRHAKNVRAVLNVMQLLDLVLSAQQVKKWIVPTEHVQIVLL